MKHYFKIFFCICKDIGFQKNSQIKVHVINNILYGKIKKSNINAKYNINVVNFRFNTLLA